MKRPGWYRARSDTLNSASDGKVRRIRFDDGTVAWANLPNVDGLGLQLCPLSCGCDPATVPTLAPASPTGYSSTCDTCDDQDPQRDAAVVIAWDDIVAQCDLTTDDPDLPHDYIAATAYSLLKAAHTGDLLAGTDRWSAEPPATRPDGAHADTYETAAPDGTPVGVHLTADRTRAIVWCKDEVRCPCGENTVLFAPEDTYRWEQAPTPGPGAAAPGLLDVEAVTASDAQRCVTHDEPHIVARCTIADLDGLGLLALDDTDQRRGEELLAAAAKAAWGRLAADSALFSAADRDYQRDLLEDACEAVRAGEDAPASDVLAQWDPHPVKDNEWAVTLRWSDGSGTTVGASERTIPMPVAVAAALTLERNPATAGVPL